MFWLKQYEKSVIDTFKENIYVYSGLFLILSTFLSIFVLIGLLGLSGNAIGHVTFLFLVLSFIPLLVAIIIFLLKNYIENMEKIYEFRSIIIHNVFFTLAIGLVVTHMVLVYTKSPLNSIMFFFAFFFWILEIFLIRNMNLLENSTIAGIYYLVISGLIFGILFHAKMWSFSSMIFFSLLFTLILFKIIFTLINKKIRGNVKNG